MRGGVVLVAVMAMMLVVVEADGRAKWAFGNCIAGMDVVNDHVYRQDFGSCFKMYQSNGDTSEGGYRLAGCDETGITMDYYESGACEGDVKQRVLVNVTCDYVTPEGYESMIRVDASITEYDCETFTVASMSTATVVILVAASFIVVGGAMFYFCCYSGRTRRRFLP